MANSSILSGMSRQKLNPEDLFTENLFQRIIYFICGAKKFISQRDRVRDVFQYESYGCFIFIVELNLFLSCNFLSWLIVVPRQFRYKYAFIFIIFIIVFSFWFLVLRREFWYYVKILWSFKFPRVGFFFHQALSIGTVFVAN